MRAIPTNAIAGLYLAERDEAAVCDDYDLTRHELLVALWYEGTHGEYRAELGEWAQSAYKALARATSTRFRRRPANRGAVSS